MNYYKGAGATGGFRSDNIGGGFRSDNIGGGFRSDNTTGSFGAKPNQVLSTVIY
jgi:hypothetical protein